MIGKGSLIRKHFWWTEQFPNNTKNSPTGIFLSYPHFQTVDMSKKALFLDMDTKKGVF